jgi:hypothetical protein
MSSNDDTINKKRSKNNKNANANSVKENTNKLLTLFKKIMYRLLFLAGIILVGSLLLYNCKVAQANMIPFCITTDRPLPIVSEPVDINIVYDYDAKEYKSTKIKFSDSKNHFYAEDKEDKNIGYFQTIYNDLTKRNNGILSVCYKKINQLPEGIIVFLGGIFQTLLFLLVGFVTFFQTMYSTYFNLFKLFLTKDYNKQNENHGIKYYVLQICSFFIFLMTFLITTPFAIVFSVFFALYSLFYPCTVKSVYVKSGDNSNEQTEQSYGLLNTIINVIKYKIRIIMVLIFVFMISDAYTTIGPLEMVVLIFCIILFCFLFNNIFKPNTPTSEMTFTDVNNLNVTNDNKFTEECEEDKNDSAVDINKSNKNKNNKSMWMWRIVETLFGKKQEDEMPKQEEVPLNIEKKNLEDDNLSQPTDSTKRPTTTLHIPATATVTTKPTVTVSKQPGELVEMNNFEEVPATVSKVTVTKPSGTNPPEEVEMTNLSEKKEKRNQATNSKSS